MVKKEVVVKVISEDIDDIEDVINLIEDGYCLKKRSAFIRNEVTGGYHLFATLTPREES